MTGADLLDEETSRIMELMRDAAETQTDVRRHVATNFFFEPTSSPDVVQVTSNLTITAVENGLIRLVTSGYYKDTVVQEEGRWCIGKRRIELDMAY